MKAMSFVVLGCAIALAAGSAGAQFKTDPARDPETSGSLITAPPSTVLFGWFDPSKFSMHHSMEFSYMSFGGAGMTMGTYTNSMMYQFANNLNARADVSMSFTPTNSFSSFGGKGANNFSGLYLRDAQLNYQPWDNFQVRLQYSQLPYGSYYYSPFFFPMTGGNGF
ncbi:MAG TPA: hypothetical protein VL221_08430 [Bacteroidota bacterium]|nr:hypothetical protein [Bacteroidota bacterium]